MGKTPPKAPREAKPSAPPPPPPKSSAKSSYRKAIEAVERLRAKEATRIAVKQKKPRMIRLTD